MAVISIKTRYFSGKKPPAVIYGNSLEMVQSNQDIFKGLFVRLVFFLVATAASVLSLSYLALGPNGLIGDILTEHRFLKLLAYFVIMGHITITCMSLSFHRYHTHKGVVLNKYIDMFMQSWLWLICGMSKQDWVSVHQYHHAHSDTEKDPHSPVQKGFWHVFLFGVKDYVEAKDWPGVLKLRKRIKTNALERFFDQNPFGGLIITSSICVILFGPLWGMVVATLNFLISPLFAVGGVNGLAHFIGYRNHYSKDNSRNLGFLLPLNFIICGELDHNNHHAHQTSCSFRHRWYEFDIGYFYINILSFFGLAEVKSVYGPENLRHKLKAQFIEFMEKDYKIKERLDELASELNTSFEEMKHDLVARWEGKKKEIEPALENLYAELRLMLKEAKQFQTVPLPV